MRKFLLFILTALVCVPVYAQTNKALQHNATRYTTSAKYENAFRTGLDAIGLQKPFGDDARFSVGFWFKRTSQMEWGTNDKHIESTRLFTLSGEHHMNFNGAMCLAVDNNKNLKWTGTWGFSAAGLTTGVSLATIEYNQWYYILITVDNPGKKVCLYLGQEPANSAAGAAPMRKLFDGTMTGTISYGYSNDFQDTWDCVLSFCDYGFNGAIDNVATYAKALTENEANISYFNPMYFKGDIKGYYEFNDQSNVNLNSVEGGVTSGLYTRYTTDHLGQDGLTDNDNSVKGTGTSGTTKVESQTQFTLVDSYEEPQYTGWELLVLRKDGVTVTVTNQNGETVNSGDALSLGDVLTINGTSTTGNLTMNVNKIPFTNGSTHVVCGNVVVTSSNEQAFTYAATTGTKAKNRNYVSRLTLDDNKGNSAEIGGAALSGTNYSIYNNRSSEIFVTEPGAEITLKAYGDAADASWMHNYVYADWNRDGVFTVDPSQTSVNGELLAHTGYSVTKHSSRNDTADPEKTSDGTAINHNKILANQTGYTPIPKFTVPADLQPGSYRVRYKLDWNSVAPEGRTNSNLYGHQAIDNGIVDDNGCIIDFTLVIPEGDVHKITINQSGDGHVEVWSADDGSRAGTGVQYQNGDGVYPGTPLYVYFLPDDTREVLSANIENGDDEIEGDTEGEPTLVNVAGPLNITAMFSSKGTAIDGVETDNSGAPAVYYNLQGIRVNDGNLTPGVYLRRVGNKVEKVLVVK